MKPIDALWTLLPFIGIAGCGSGAIPTIRPQAISDMHCEQVQVHHAKPGAPANSAGPYYAEGCGKIWRYVVGCNVGGLCMNPSGTDVSELLSRQAAFDLSCPATDLAISALNADTFGVTGCGKKASYVLVCGTGGCKAIQNTQSQ
jgi:hypothetical protein